MENKKHISDSWPNKAVVIPRREEREYRGLAKVALSVSIKVNYYIPTFSSFFHSFPF